MAYIPKSKILKKYTKGNELIYLDTGEEFIGSYIKTNDGSFYAGHSNTNLGSKLIKKENEVYNHANSLKYFNKQKHVRKYNYSGKGKSHKKRIQKTKTPSVIKKRPTMIDYTRGYFKRYFTRKINDYNYIEINENIFNALVSQNKNYDYNFYIAGSITWHLRGIDVTKKNNQAIQEQSRRHPHLSSLFPALDEYAPPAPKPMNNLTAQKGELYFADGREYAGLYHLHPTHGPMEGAFHTPHPHARLYYEHTLPNITNPAYEEFLQTYNQVKCYKCITISPNNTNIIENLFSATIGCPPDFFKSHDAALDSCPPTMDISPLYPVTDNNRPNYSSYNLNITSSNQSNSNPSGY